MCFHVEARLTLERNEEKNGEVDVDDSIKRDEWNHGNIPHTDDADPVLDLSNAAVAFVLVPCRDIGR